jgi:hypothetical protein
MNSHHSVNLDECLHHSNLDGVQAREVSFYNDGRFYILKMENPLSGLKDVYQFEYNCSSVDLKRLMKQNLKLHLNRGRLIYTKSRVFGLSHKLEVNANLKSVKVSQVSVPSGSQSKSNSYKTDHPRVVVGQYGPSSSEDG